MSSAQIMVSKYQFIYKEPELLGEMYDFKSGTEISKMNLEHLVQIQKKKPHICFESH